VGNEDESVTVAATAAGAPKATVKIMPADQDTSTTNVHEVYLTPGTNTPITVTVTAENGSTNTYTVPRILGLTPQRSALLVLP
jgi:hypothetical protein